MSIPRTVIDLTIESSDSESIKSERNRRATKRKTTRIREGRLQQSKQELKELRKRSRQRRKNRRYIRTAESFLTTDYRRQLAADIQEYAREVKRLESIPGTTWQLWEAYEALRNNTSLSHLMP